MLRTRLIEASVIIVSVAVVSTAAAQAAIRARDARAVIGRTAIVEDVVSQVSREPQSGFTYLNFGGEFPQQLFRAVIPEPTWERLTDGDYSVGTSVRISGLVRDGPRGPEILCLEPSQLQRLKASPIQPVVGLPVSLPAARKCCRVCSTGKACGDSCISAQLTCRQPPGCACGAVQ